MYEAIKLLQGLIKIASYNVEKEPEFEKNKNLSKLKDVQEFIEKNI